MTSLYLKYQRKRKPRAYLREILRVLPASRRREGVEGGERKHLCPVRHLLSDSKTETADADVRSPSTDTGEADIKYDLALFSLLFGHTDC